MLCMLLAATMPVSGHERNHWHVDDSVDQIYIVNENYWTLGYKLTWQNPTDWNKGTVGAGLIVTGNYLQLEEYSDLNNDIPFTTTGNYTLSDGVKIEVTGGVVRLKAISGTENDWPFDLAGNYTYDPVKIEVIGGVAKLVGTDSIYAQWHMNEAAGTDVDDASSNNRDGTTQNMEDADWGVAKLNNGLRFNEGGTKNEYIDFGSIASFERTDSFSFEFWLKILGPSDSTIIRTIWKYATTGYLMYIQNKHIYLFLDGSDGGRIIVHGDANVQDSNWHHIVITYNGSSSASGVNIYVDGSLDSMSTDADALASSILTGTTLKMCDETANYFLNGYLDEVIIYEKELSLSEVQARYNSGSGTEEEGLSTTDPTIVSDTGHIFTAALDTVTETATKFAGSAIKYQVSSNDGVTWKWWNGAAWIAITGGQTDSWYYANETNSASDAHTQIANLAVNGTFKFRAFLHSDGIANPELSNLYLKEPITYSTMDNLYVDTKDASQIDAIDVLSWLTATFTETIPANTDIRILFSTNNRVSWLTWDGSAWQAPVGATTRTDATSITDAETNFSDLTVGSNLLDLRIFSYTSDNSVRPSLDNLNVTGEKGYASSGTWESNVVDTTDEGVVWDILRYITELSGGASITIKARSADLVANVSSKSYSIAIANADDLSDNGIIYRYIQFKAEFTGSGTESAVLQNIRAYYFLPYMTEVTP